MTRIEPFPPVWRVSIGSGWSLVERRYTIAPGSVADTEFFKAGGFGDSSKMIDMVAAQTLLGRVGKPDDIVGCIDWLLSESGAWTTGQTISINGGKVLVR